MQASWNPNNKMVQQVGMSTFPTYSITHFKCIDLHLRFGKIIHSKNSHLITKQLEEEPLTKHPHEQGEDSIYAGTPRVSGAMQHVAIFGPIQTQVVTPLYPQILAITKVPRCHEFDLLRELQNLSFKIPLLQAIRDVPIYAKTICK